MGEEQERQKEDQKNHMVLTWLLARQQEPWATSQAGQGEETHHSTAHGALATLPQLEVSVGLARQGLRTATLQHTYGNKPCASVTLGHAPGRPPFTLLLAPAGQSN